MFKNDGKVSQFVDSPYFDLSQTIIKLEEHLNLTQKEAAEICNLTLSEFLDYEMGDSKDYSGYQKIINELKK